MSTRVLIAYNAAILPECDLESEAERAVTSTAEAVRDHLIAARFEVGSLEIGHDLEASLEEAARWRPDVIFNLFEGWGDDPASEARAALALTSLAVPLTGCSERSLRIAGSKHLAKAAVA